MSAEFIVLSAYPGFKEIDQNVMLQCKAYKCLYQGR